MRKLGFEVWENDHEDFFEQTLPPRKLGTKTTVLVSNPPFSIKQRILRYLEEQRWERYALFLPAAIQFSRYFLDLYREKVPSLILHPLRCAFLKPEDGEPMKRGAGFGVMWLCVGIDLPDRIMFPSQAVTDGAPPLWYKDPGGREGGGSDSDGGDSRADPTDAAAPIRSSSA